jgi:signal transduction histidine kinase
VAELDRVLVEAGALLGADPERTMQQRWPARRELDVDRWPVRDASGTDLGRLVVFRDVTQEREVDRMKSEFVSLVSHELRTPLTSIKGYVALIADGSTGELSAEQTEFLAIVAEDVDRLVHLVNDLLDVSRIEAGALDVRTEWVDLAVVVRDAAVRFRPGIQSSGQRLVLELPDNLPAVWADPDAIVRVLLNLISNAHKYTSAGGTITVRVSSNDEGLRVEVEDTGIGLSQEDQARLFSKFFRARDPAAASTGGTGLGLVIARGLVEAQGGRLTVASSPGRGSTFAFTLPRG